MNRSTQIRSTPIFISRILFLVLLLVSMITVCQATVYYVATTGNDANAGTINSPFLTIKKGVSVLYAGDSLLVRAGIYNESVHSWETVVRSGTSWSNAITIASYPEESVTIRPVSGGAAFWLVWGPNKEVIEYLIIDGFIIDGQFKAKHGIKLQGCSGGCAAGAPPITIRNIQISNIEVKNSIDSGILSSGSGHKFLYIKSHHNGFESYPDGGSFLDHGLYLSGNNSIIAYCEFYNNAGWGIQINHQEQSDPNYQGEISENNLVYNNYAHDNGGYDPAHPTTGCGIVFWWTRNNMAFNNILTDNNSCGIQLHEGSSKVYNNTIYGNKTTGVAITSISSNNEVRNNVIYQNGSIPIDNKGTNTTATNNITINPLFVDALNNDFHLQLGSPAIDQGVTLTEVTTDFDGNTRPQGTAYDVGAYEYTSGCNPPQPVIAWTSPTTFCAGGSTVLDGGSGYTNYSWSNGATTQTITVSSSGTFVVTVSNDVSCPGSSQPVTVIVAPCTRISQSGCFEAESGTLTGPVQATFDVGTASADRYISTGAFDNGTASYSFNVGTTGMYKISARVFASGPSNDSWYFSIDGGAEDIWDLNPTADPSEFNVWRLDEVTKRGSGTFDAPESDPYLVQLSAGSHTLSLRGREVDTKLDYFCLDKTTTTGIPSRDKEALVKVYPNPTSGNLVVTLPSDEISGNVVISLYNLMGQQIRLKNQGSGANTSLTQKSIELDISYLPEGIYFLQVQIGDEVVTAKVVKE